jgi:hypothetical protein
MKTTITLFAGIILCFNIYSQVSSYNFQNSNTTFVFETGVTVLGTESNDNQVFNNNTTGETAPQTDIGFPIGFDFYYNGSYYSRFAVNTNGWIMLGNGSFTIGNTTSPVSYSTTSGFANIISVLGRDLQGQTGSELSYKLTGSAPSRVLVVQWKNYRRYGISSGESFNFQIKLEESGYNIKFIYGNLTTTNTSTSTSNNPTQIGLRGAVNSEFKNRTTTSSWASTSAGTLNTNTMRLTTTVKPESGLVYTWSPANMSYTSSTAIQYIVTPVRKHSTNNIILQIPVVTSGLTAPLTVSSITFNSSGSTTASDISNAKVFYTGTSSVFSMSQQFGSDFNNPSGSFTINGSQVLRGGTNYFWLTYDIRANAGSGNQVDAQCNSIMIGTSRTPTVQSPVGSRTIQNTPLNGTYTIGLSLFNKLLGKNLQYKKAFKKGTLESLNIEDSFNKKKAANVTENSNGNREIREVVSDIDSYVLMDGTSEYKGETYIEFSESLKNANPDNYYIKDYAGIYTNLTAALNDLSNRGIEGAVNFLLIDETYIGETFPLLIDDINGQGPQNTITIKPAAGVTPEILMSSGSAVIKIQNSEYVIIDGSNTPGGTSRDLSIISSSSSISYGIWCGSTNTSPYSNITIKNCIIKTGENSQGSTPVIFSDASNTSVKGYFNNIEIKNNLLMKGRQGVYINGGTYPGSITGVEISGNSISASGTDAVGYMGIYTQGINDGIISGNTIGNLNTSGDEDDKGIWLASGSHNVKVTGNKIFNIGYSGSNGYGAHGIFVSANHNNAGDTVCNNVIYNIYGDGWSYTDQLYALDNPCGITLYSSVSQNSISILYNSISMYGNTLIKNNALSAGIFVSSNSYCDIRNNIISNNLGTGSDSAYGTCGIYAQNSHTQFSSIDYNNYFINPSGNGIKAIGKVSTIRTSTSLSNWRGVTFQDKSSLSSNPGFTSSTDLTPDINSVNCWSLNGRGIQIPGMNVDYSGSNRSSSSLSGAPDIGAYEFTPAAQPPQLTGNGSISDGATTWYLFGEDTLASITWHGNNLPSANTMRYFSGINPPSPTSGSYGNCYWLFEPTGGAGYTFDINLYWDAALRGTIVQQNNISIANFTSNTWEHYSSSNDTISRIAGKNGLSKLSLFTIDDEEDPLPVNIIFMECTTLGRNTELLWKTSFEINNKGFEIERKMEGTSQWQKAGFVEGRGNSTMEITYKYTDYNLHSGIYSYRLKQIDFSGAAEYFDFNAFAYIGLPQKFDMKQNYPNPSNPVSKIEFNVPVKTHVKINVYDVLGKEVQVLFNGECEPGYYSAEFDGSRLSSGIYFYRIHSDHFSKTMKLILIK